MVKLSPNVTDITVIARAAEEAGADAITQPDQNRRIPAPQRLPRPSFLRTRKSTGTRRLRQFIRNEMTFR